jgi:hypothetical protein
MMWSMLKITKMMQIKGAQIMMLLRRRRCPLHRRNNVKCKQNQRGHEDVPAIAIQLQTRKHWWRRNP